MGIFDSAKRHLGITDTHLIATGTLARGNVISIKPSGMTIGDDSNLAYGPEKVCELEIEVVGLEGEETYTAHAVHPIPLIYIPKLQEEGAAVAIRVDPADPQNIALDLATEVPAAPIFAVSDDGTKQKVVTSKGAFTAAEILRDGAPCSVEVLAVIPLNQLTQDGKPATGLVLNVTREGVAPYQAQVGTFIPEAAVDRVVVGARLPARWVKGPGEPTDVNLVTPDWPAVLA